MMVYWLILLTVAAVAAFALMLSVRLLTVVRKLQEQVRNLQNTQDETPAASTPVSFSTSLGQAERKAAETQVQFKGGLQSDKYSYVASMAGQGLDSTAIAATLQMSVVEVEQLLSLARLRHGGKGQ